MNREDIHQKIAVALAESLNVEPEKIKPQANLQADLGAESIDLLEIIFRLEKEFGIKIRDEEFIPRSKITVAAITNYVRNQLGQKWIQEALNLCPARSQ